MHYLQIKNLAKKFENFSLHVDDINIKKGSFFGILGHSAAGKSTLLNLLCGFEEPDSGDILVSGKSILSLKPHERGIAYLFQNSLLFEGLSVYENLSYLLKVKGLKNQNKRIESSLSECEVLHLMDREVKSLSGGERQRVALAMAVMLRAKLLLLDEPFSNLDTALKIKMRIFVKKIIHAHNITAIMVTHDKDDAFLLFDEMMLLESGRILQKGTPKSIYEKPKSLSVAQYFGFENIFKLSEANKKFGLDFDEDINGHILIPYHAISLGDNLTQVISEIIYIEGRYKIKCESGLVFFSSYALKDECSIYIKKELCSFLSD